jgi:choline dehydrogenase-like flavoprotein
VVNRFLQSWDAHNVFVMGSSVFPQNIGYNPLGLAGALTYWSARAIRTAYLKKPGPMVAMQMIDNAELQKVSEKVEGKLKKSFDAIK